MNPKITIVGRVGQDPEAIGSGIRFRVATNDRVKNDATGEWEDRDTSWWTVKAWKTLANDSKDQLRKGQEVVIVGTIREETWNDKDGNKRTTSVIVADAIAVATKTLAKNLVSAGTASDPWQSN